MSDVEPLMFGMFTSACADETEGSEGVQATHSIWCLPLKRPVRPQTYLGFLQERGHELHITPVRGNVQGGHAFAVLEVDIALLLPL